MYKFFDRNTVLTYVAMPVILVLLRLRLLLRPMDGYIATTIGDKGQFSPLYRMVFGDIVNGSVTSIVFSLIATILAAFIVAAISNRFHFMERQSGLPGALFIILTSGFVMAQGLYPIHVFLVFFLWSVHILFAGSDCNKPMAHVFGGALFFSVACLFYAKGIVFIPFIFIAIIAMRMFNVRSFLALLMGLLAPFSIMATACFYHDSFMAVADEWWQSVIAPMMNYPAGKYSWSYLIIMGVLTTMSVLSAIAEMQKLSIIESRLVRVIIWLLVFSTVCVIFRQYSFEMLYVIASSVAILMSPWFHRMRSSLWQEVTVWIILAITIFIQWKIQGMSVIA
ncbi:MAG: DUF6427 family protein [Bacteroidales bacterium]|nr:DUF6427 family protein [Bacteroidales bacterium]